MHEHFDLITNLFKYKCETSQIFIHPFKKNCGECKMQLMNSGFNNIQSEGFNSCENVNSSRNAKKIINLFKYNMKH
jgi:hypothetical protein